MLDEPIGAADAAEPAEQGPGPTPAADELKAADPAEVAARIRAAAGVTDGDGPDDAHLHAGVAAFVAAFEYWYTRVIRYAVKDYRSLVIGRINPFIRRIELDCMGPDEAAARLVDDYNVRNFVTAGGWALEGLAESASPRLHKSGTAGVDLEWYDHDTATHHLYAIKSGKVTRNSDILAALKTHARKAESNLRQSRGPGNVEANYVVSAGRTSQTYEDGIRRPASGTFWSEALALPEGRAVELALELAAEAGRVVRVDAGVHLAAMRLLVADYLESRDDVSVVDWDFVVRRNMTPRGTWASQDKARHQRAISKLLETGYTPAARSR